MARTSAELTPEEILIIGDLVPVWSPWQVPVVNTGWTGLEYKTLSWSWYALTSNPLSQFASTTSAQLAGVISDETWSGWNLVFSNSPALTTPSISAINVSGWTLTLPTGASDTLIGKITTDTFSTWVKTFLNWIFGLRNVANTFTSFFTNTNTASRTYTLKDASGTLAFTTDITGTNSGTNTGDVTLAGTPNYITIAGQVITRALIDLTTHVTWLLPFANIANVATGTVMYRKTASTGPMEAQTLATLKTDLWLTGTNSGDQTSIVGITWTLSQFNTACTDADFATGWGTATGTNTGDQTSTAWLSNTTNKNLVTDAQLTVIGNTSWTNTGDNATNTTSNAYALTTPAFWQYSISRTVSTWNMTVAVKNYLGNDPSPTVPIYVMIGGVMRTITSALSFTNSAWFNWWYTWSTELATKEVDWFCYFVWRTGESTVKLTASRIPYATIYWDFNTADATTEKGNLGNFGSPISTDPVVNIGRFNAILSAGAWYTWSIPATSVVINSPTIFTRTIQWWSQTWWTANNLLFYYTVNWDRVDFSFDASGTSNSTSSYITLPFSAKTIMAHNFALWLTYDNWVDLTTPWRADLYGQYCTLFKDSAYWAWTASGAKIIRWQWHYYI